LHLDPAAERGFYGLPDSQMKMALYRIQTAKRPETRAKRIAETVRTASLGRLPR